MLCLYDLYCIKYRHLSVSVWVFVGGGRRCVPNSNGSCALFSLEVKTQTKTKNAKGHATGPSWSVYLFNNNKKHTQLLEETNRETPRETDRRVAESVFSSLLGGPARRIHRGLHSRQGTVQHFRGHASLIFLLMQRHPHVCTGIIKSSDLAYLSTKTGNRGGEELNWLSQR